MANLIAFLLGAGIVLGLLLYNSMAWGYVLLKFYEWFLLPVFVTLPHIQYWQAVGLMLFISLFYSGKSTTNKDDKTSWSSYFIGPWLTLLFGYCVYSWFIHG